MKKDFVWLCSDCQKGKLAVVICDGYPMCQDCFDDYAEDHPQIAEVAIPIKKRG